MNTDKNSLFVFVEDADVENFVSNYVDGEEIFGQTDIYNNKIAFLGSSGKIATHRWIYGSGQQVIKFTVKNSLTNITSSNNATVIEYGSNYVNTITVDEGCILSSININVGGTDVTQTSWNAETNTINIDYVTGNISITGVVLKGVSISYTLPNCTSTNNITEVFSTFSTSNNAINEVYAHILSS